jgi:hypothetical protein
MNPTSDVGNAMIALVFQRGFTDAESDISENELRNQVAGKFG